MWLATRSANTIRILNVNNQFNLLDLIFGKYLTQKKNRYDANETFTYVQPEQFIIMFYWTPNINISQCHAV